MEPSTPDYDEQHAYLCPVGQQLMQDPVVAGDGHTYEREAIERWFRLRTAQGDLPTSPCTGAVLAHKDLVPNHALRNAIQASVRAQLRQDHAHPERSPSPPAKRAKGRARKKSLVEDFLPVASQLVEAGDVQALVAAMHALGCSLARKDVLASVLHDRLRVAVAPHGEPVLESLLAELRAHQEHHALVALQALAVARLDSEELSAGACAGFAGVVSALVCAHSNGLALLVECAVVSLQEACDKTMNLTREEQQQLADVLCLVIRPSSLPPHQVTNQKRARQRAMEGLALLLKRTAPSGLEASQPNANTSPIALGTLGQMAHAALLQLQRSVLSQSRIISEECTRTDVRIVLALLAALVPCRMWTFGVQHFLQLVAKAMREHAAHVPIQLEGVSVLVRCCQLRSSSIS